jgi:hypothetical protein
MLVTGDHGLTQYEATVSYKIIASQVTDMVFKTSVYSPFNHLKASSLRKLYLVQSP